MYTKALYYSSYIIRICASILYYTLHDTTVLIYTIYICIYYSWSDGGELQEYGEYTSRQYY